MSWRSIRLVSNLGPAAALAIVCSGAPARAQSQGAQPAALSLMQRDWVLMNWALKYFDADHDIDLSAQEASTAAQAFRQMADADHDGRITPDEYRAARASILAHY